MISLKFGADVIRVDEVERDADTAQEVVVAATLGSEFSSPFQRLIEFCGGLLGNSRTHRITAGYDALMEVVDLDILYLKHPKSSASKDRQ